MRLIDPPVIKNIEGDGIWEFGQKVVGKILRDPNYKNPNEREGFAGEKHAVGLSGKDAGVKYNFAGQI